MQCKFSKPQAIAFIIGENTTSAIKNIIKFHQKENCVSVVADTNGLPYISTGFFGFHVHKGDNCDGIAFQLNHLEIQSKKLPVG